MKIREQTKKNKNSSAGLMMFIAMLLFLLVAGGCGGGSSTTTVVTPERGPVPIIEVEIESFRLAPWSEQEWQNPGGVQDLSRNGQIHPMLPLYIEVVLNANRPELSVEDQVWISVYLIKDTGASAVLRSFSSPEDEPIDDPLYLGFQQLNLQGGKETITVEIYPETGILPGNYKGLRAEFFSPGYDAELIGQKQFEWLGNLTMLDLNNLSPIDKAWSELTIQADSPIPPGTPGFDFEKNSIVDPETGFSRLFEGDTPYSRKEQKDNNPFITGYYANISLSLEILAPSGTVDALLIMEENGLSFWNPEANNGNGAFENTFLWEGRHISEITDPFADKLEDGATFENSFPRGDNGIDIVVGYPGKAPPRTGLKVSDISLSIAVHDSKKASMRGFISALSDETIRPRKYTAAADYEDWPFGDDPDIPYILDNPRKVNLPVSAANRRVDFSNSDYTWKEELRDSSLWEKQMGGNKVDYVGEGTRHVKDLIDFGKGYIFANRSYFYFEKYRGLLHRVPDPGMVTIHDLSSVSGTRTGIEDYIWVFGKRFKILTAGAEFRNVLSSKTASERNDDGSYSLITDPEEIVNYEKFSSMESEFKIDVEVLTFTVYSFPLYSNNLDPFDPRINEIRLFENVNEIPALTARYYCVSVSVGATFTLYFDLRLTDKLALIPNGVRHQYKVALMPGVSAHGWIEGGVDVIFASAKVGFKLLFVDLKFVPEFVMEGDIIWQNDSSRRMPVATSNWRCYPRLGLEISILDGELYVKVKFLCFSRKYVLFSFRGPVYNLELWKYTAPDNGLSLPLRRAGETL